MPRQETENRTGESLRRQYLYDAVFVLGGNFHLVGVGTENPGLYPSDLRDSDEYGILGAGLRNVAALEMYLRGETKNIVFTGGVSKKNMARFGHIFPQLPTEAEVYQERFGENIKRMREIADYKKRFEGLEELNLYAAEQSANTRGNWDSILDFSRNNNWQKIAIVTNDYHKGRVRLQYQQEVRPISQSQDLRVKIVGAEGFVKRAVPGRYDGVISNYENSSMQPMHRRIVNERRGRRQLRYGMYRFAEQKGKIGDPFPRRLTGKATLDNMYSPTRRKSKIGLKRPIMPETLTYDRMRSELTSIIDNAFTLAYGSGYLKSKPGKLCLWYGLSAAILLRPLLNLPTILYASPLAENVGGPAENPSMMIDILAGDVIREIFDRNQTKINYFMEENKVWVTNRDITAGDSVNQFAVIDPLDGSISGLEGRRDQAAGMIFGDQFGNFAGTIVDLTSHRIIVIEQDASRKLNNIKFFNYDEIRNVLSLLNLPMKKNTEVNSSSLKIATLSRRFKDGLMDLPLFREMGFFPKSLSLGGVMNLNVILGELDSAIDPTKGRPLKEALIWDNMAQKAGCIVTDPQGNPIDFENLLQRAIRGEISMDSRIPLITSRNKTVHDRILTLLEKPKTF